MVPSGHRWHRSVPPEKNPASHSSQPLRVALAWLPTGHSSHSHAPTWDEIWLSGHAWHCEPFAEKNPGLQYTHSVRAALASVPHVQSRHLVAPADDTVPGPQGWQRPIPFENVPAGHSVHAVWFALGCDAAPQVSHSHAPWPDEISLIGHRWH